MSIINDALKKVQNQKQDPANPAPQNPQNTGATPPAEGKPPAFSVPSNASQNSSEEQKDLTQFLPQKEHPAKQEPVVLTETIKPKPPEIHWTGILRSSAILVFLVTATFYVYTTYTSKAIASKKYAAPAKKKMSLSLPSAQEIKQAILPASAPAPKPKREGLVISGIVASGDRYSALINDRIYEMGDMLDGKEIINITDKTVEVKDGEATKTFYLEQ